MRDEETIVTYHCDFCGEDIKGYSKKWNSLLGKYDVCDGCRDTIKKWIDEIEKEADAG